MAEEDSVVRLATGRKGEAAFLGVHHLLAATRFEALLRKAQLTPRVTMSYDASRVGGRRSGGNGVETTSDSAAEARRRLNDLAQSLPADCWNVLFDICGTGKGLQVVETERGWPRRSAKLVLRIALDQLAAIWGLESHAAGQVEGRGRSWLEQRLPIVPPRTQYKAE